MNVQTPAGFQITAPDYLLGYWISVGRQIIAQAPKPATGCERVWLDLLVVASPAGVFSPWPSEAQE